MLPAIYKMKCPIQSELRLSKTNKLSDAHGKSIKQYKPSERHEELAVNVAGTMTTFLLETYNKVAEKNNIES
jgi:hypothetical protein